MIVLLMLSLAPTCPEVVKCIATNGVIATYSSTQVQQPSIPFLDMMYMDLTLRMIIVYAMPEPAKVQAINDITAALKAETLRHRIAHIVPLDEFKSGASAY